MGWPEGGEEGEEEENSTVVSARSSARSVSVEKCQAEEEEGASCREGES
jgi:hypothetical protein